MKRKKNATPLSKKKILPVRFYESNARVMSNLLTLTDRLDAKNKKKNKNN